MRIRQLRIVVCETHRGISCGNARYTLPELTLANREDMPLLAVETVRLRGGEISIPVRREQNALSGWQHATSGLFEEKAGEHRVVVLEHEMKSAYGVVATIPIID